MANYANQKLVHVVKPEVEFMYNKEGENDFMHSIKWDKFYPVMRELNGNELKVWLYCFKWNNKDSFYYSPAALTKDFGLSESTAQRAFKRLEDLGYLEKDSDNFNGYTFHPNGLRKYSN